MIQCTPRALLWSYGAEGECYNDYLPVYRSGGNECGVFVCVCMCMCVHVCQCCALTAVHYAGHGQ